MNITGYDVNKSSEENRKKFASEMNDLLALEFDIPLEKKLEIDVNNKDFENLHLSSEKIAKLELLIDFKF